MTPSTSLRVLLTGATGFIGQALVPALLDAGFQVALLLREAYAQAGGQAWPAVLTAVRPQLDVAYADLRNFQLTSRAVAQIQPDVVLHLAAAGVTDPFLAVETAVRHNVNGTINLARACFEKQTVRQLIVARTPGEQTALNVYATSKAAAWAFCQMYGRTHQWPIHGAMIFQAYGPGQSRRNFIPAALEAAVAGQNFPMTSGQQQRDWVHIRDIVAGLIATIGASLVPGETVELGSGEAVSVAEVAQMLYQLAGQGGQPQVGVLPSRPGEIAVQVANAQQTHRQIGWQTAVSLADGLQQLVASRLLTK